ncbi:RapGAP/RanGAP domain-containing protein [Heterostelium album PN500]|uniref:RapGAP/RanGAP domain-containing protein n=1 Tax=Heterostelium pallidum (strain ATCC 26659 / Pp 5 / PN500) TaxID=670386 RepID=D3BUQ0_HETP5|nr:RapGAP/RanGAP domain-containing protein [Heterostelium album PN500]EFA74838.1 RapGAP/RanGAP domain-containing protein [Heterostelium album PN500]|eukprot:XP_020426972.1 RapGAP/RanGAP domain-containing protein [Heterostelium album PN500]
MPEECAPRVSNQPSLYRQHFYGKPHSTYVSYYSPIGPLAITITLDNDNNYKCLVYTEKGYELIQVPRWSVYRNCWRFIFCRKPTSYHIMWHVKPELKDIKIPKLKISKLEDELLRIYEPEFSKVMKVGILYCREGQKDEAEMLFNVANNTSREYDEFLNWIGDRVELKGFQGYNGGLDIVHGNSGTHSIYGKHNDVEIMFHVSTMLPFYPNDPKQIERKKHLGNDRIMIVFNDGPQSYQPNTMKSKQTQTVILVQPIRNDSSSASISIAKPASPNNNNSLLMEEKNGLDNIEDVNRQQSSGSTNQYIVSIASKEEVPDFDPPLPNPPIFNRDARFKQFLYDKLINGSSSLRQAPVFQTKTQREKNFVFLNFVNKHTNQK